MRSASEWLNFSRIDAGNGAKAAPRNLPLRPCPCASQSCAMRLTRRHILKLIAAGLASPSFASGGPIVIFAAASLKNVLDTVVARIDAEITVSYGGSGTLARQIQLGAPADLFISADPNWAQIAGGTPENLLTNQLVMVAPGRAAPLVLSDLPQDARIAMGHAQAVPAGRYGKAALEHLDLWGRVAQNIIPTDNVRAALALVARGEVPFGIVYATDALAEPAVTVVATFPPDSHPQIRYAMTALSDAGQDIAMRLAAPDTAKIYLEHGFGLP